MRYEGNASVNCSYQLPFTLFATCAISFILTLPAPIHICHTMRRSLVATTRCRLCRKYCSIYYCKEMVVMLLLSKLKRSPLFVLLIPSLPNLFHFHLGHVSRVSLTSWVGDNDWVGWPNIETPSHGCLGPSLSLFHHLHTHPHEGINAVVMFSIHIEVQKLARI